MSNDESFLTQPTPLSQFLRMPVLSAPSEGQSDLLKSIRFFSDKPAMLSKSLGLPTLSNTKFSTLLGIPASASESESLRKVLQSFSLART